MTARGEGDGDREELAGDLVGSVSARLLAAGFPRTERLGALRLLGALDTLADRDDRVRRPLAQVGAEFDLPIAELDGWLDALVEVGAVDVDGGGIVLLGRDEPAGMLRLQDFLGVVADLDEARVRRRTPAVLRPAAAVLAAAAMIAAFVLAPGLVRDDSRERPVTLAGPAGSSTSTAAEPDGTSTTADAVVPGRSTLPESVAGRTTPCPTGVPTLEITEIAGATIAGVIRNPADQPLAVTAFTVIASTTAQDLSVPGTLSPIVVPAGGTAGWEITLPVTAPPGTDVRTDIERWEWQGAATGCPAAL